MLLLTIVPTRSAATVLQLILFQKWWIKDDQLLFQITEKREPCLPKTVYLKKWLRRMKNRDKKTPFFKIKYLKRPISIMVNPLKHTSKGCININNRENLYVGNLIMMVTIIFYPTWKATGISTKQEMNEVPSLKTKPESFQIDFLSKD